MAHKRIKVRRTIGEFCFLEKKVREMGKQDLQSYVRAEIRVLTKKIGADPNSITVSGEKIQKTFYIPEETYRLLHQLSFLMQRPVSSIIDDFIIAPLLKPK